MLNREGKCLSCQLLRWQCYSGALPHSHTDLFDLRSKSACFPRKYRNGRSWGERHRCAYCDTYPDAMSLLIQYHTRHSYFLSQRLRKVNVAFFKNIIIMRSRRVPKPTFNFLCRQRIKGCLDKIRKVMVLLKYGHLQKNVARQRVTQSIEHSHDSRLQLMSAISEQVVAVGKMN